MKTKFIVVAALILVFIQLTPTFVFSQGIGVNNPAPDASSVLDVASTNKGMLVPRMTSAQRIAIVAPATGLLVYDTSLNSFYFYDGTVWKSLATGATGWSLTGNAGTNPTTNFLGSTDNQPLVFKLNNNLAGFIDNQDGAFLGRNTFFGKEAGLNHTTDGYENTFVGFKAGLQNTLGDFNTGFGSYVLMNMVSGYSNLALGSQALMNATTSFQNCAVGIGAMTNANGGFHNQAFGYHVMFATGNPGIGNHAFGFETLLNTSGNYNSAFGQTCMRSNTTGTLNCAFGSSAMYNNTTGSSNVAVGEFSMVNNTSGNGNVAVGRQSAQSMSTATNIVAVGMSSLQLNLSSNNVAVGTSAGSTYAAYNGCTFIGNSTDANASGYTNSSAFGGGAIVTANHQVKIGNTFVAQIGGAVNWSVISDGRFKNNIRENVKGLDFILALRPVTYNLDVTAYNKLILGTENSNSGDPSSPVQTTLYSGFIAQEVEAAAAKAGYEFSGVHHPQSDQDAYAISYAEFVVPLVKAVQELQQQNQELQSRYDTMSQNVAQLMKQIELLTTTANRK